MNIRYLRRIAVEEEKRQKGELFKDDAIAHLEQELNAVMEGNAYLRDLCRSTEERNMQMLEEIRTLTDSNLH